MPQGIGLARIPIPDRPVDLAVIGSVGSIELDWADSVDPDVTSYRVYRGMVFGGPYELRSSGISTSTYVDSTELIPGVMYYYVVTSVTDVDAESSYSNEVLADWVSAGQVPNGGNMSGVPLTLSDGTANEIRLSWDTSCLATDTDYEVYGGQLGNYMGHTPITCSTGGALTTSFVPAAGNIFYLVVPTNGFREGSYDTDGMGFPRSASTSACLPQSVAACP